MTTTFAQRLTRVPQSFIREILQVTLDPSVISFAGGLPNAATFPVTELAVATQKVYQTQGKGALQYSTTRGLLELRQHIAEDLQQRSGLDVTADDILITSGSQQGLDLIGKVFLNRDDPVAMERPGYLGAIQALSVYEPNLMAIPLDEQGLEVQALDLVLNHAAPKLLYTVPSYQNPSGISYSEGRRREVADRLRDRDIILAEDDPYGQLRYDGEKPTLLKSLLPDKTVLLGSFSKTVAPGLRLGWLCAEHGILEKLTLVKQATDLHTSTLNQQILLQYLLDNDLDAHIQQINALYRQQRDTMIQALERYFPVDVKFTRPQGGMFRWITLPEDVSSLEMFGLAIKEKVAFVPGTPFIMVPLKSLAAVKRARANSEALETIISDPQQTREILVFAPETYRPDCQLNVRVFVPLLGIPEDPATGSANSCLAGYLSKHQVLDSSTVDIQVEQGMEIL